MQTGSVRVIRLRSCTRCEQARTTTDGHPGCHHVTLDPKARPPLDPSTRKPLERCKDRLEYLRASLSEAGTRVVIPTPVLSEVLVGAGTARSQYLTEITTSHTFLVAI